MTLRDRLAAMTDDELLAIVPSDAIQPGPWGASGSATVDGARVFLKRIALTDIEAARPYSTRNHFRLPNFYNYGVGSAGFGVWRELAAHEAVADHDLFPRLLHHRVMPRTVASGGLPWSHDEYVAYWNGNAAIGRFMAAREAATAELWIVLEHLPHTVFTWLVMNQARVDHVLADVFAAIGELKARGIFHFDTHLGNVVTDGDRCRVGDFGLANSTDFELTASERSFLARHAHYDYGVTFASLGVMLAMALGEQPSARTAVHIDKLDDLPVSYDPAFKAALRRYKAPIAYMLDFLHRMRRGPSKRARYDDAALARMLRDAGVPT